MKRYRSLILLPALLLAGAALAQETKLEFKLVPGTFRTQSTSRVEQVLTIMGQAIPTKADSTTVTRSTIGPRAADGSVRLEQKTESIAAKVQLPNGTLTFDSTKPEATKADNEMLQALADIFKASTSAVYTIVLGKDNRAVSVDGIEKALAEAPEAVRGALKDELSADAIKEATNQAYSLFPDKPVKKGDRWTRETVARIGGGQTLTFENFYEYQGTVEKAGKTYDKISVFTNGVKYAIKAPAGGQIDVKDSDLKIDSSSGTLLYDRELGRVVESTSTVHIVGAMTLSVNNMDLGTKLDLTMEQSSAIK
jgi:hypothetical protein